VKLLLSFAAALLLGGAFVSLALLPRAAEPSPGSPAAVGEPAPAQPPAAPEPPPRPADEAEKFDFTQPQSPPRPSPKWLKIIDQGANDPRLKGYFTPEGLKVEIVADAPTVVNPVGMTFADDGTPYVLEWRPSPGDDWHEVPVTFTYKDGTTRQVATMKKRVKDVVKTLRDTRGAGRYDDAKVILEEELPSSILLHDGWLYVTGRGSVRRYRQSEPGGKYDVKEVIAQGFCGFHHHQVSGMTIGNDGWLYLTSGDDDNVVEGSDGSRATVLRTGAVFRCRPDGSKMQAFALGFRNPYRDVAFDTAFNMFHADNDNEDGSKFTGCRLMHIVEGCDFGWRLKGGARCCVPDHVRGAIFGELPGKVQPLLKTGRGSPAGLLIYNDTRFPENFRGLLYYPDVFRKLIRAYKVEKRGATFAVAEEFEFMKSDDPLFRPCEMVLGPDGAMYVVDWRTDSGGAGRLWGDGQHGRIYRLTWGGTKDQPALPLRPMDSWAKIVKQADEDLLRTLESPEASDRARAQKEIVKRGDRFRPALLKLLKDAEKPAVARFAALGALESFWNADVQEAFLFILANGDADLRRLAADGLGLNAKAGDAEVHDALLKALNDADPAVRRAVALAMGHVAADGAADALVNTLAFDEGKDAYLRDGLVRAIEALGKPGIDRLVALGHSGVDKDLERVVEAFAAMRTRPAADAVPSLLDNPHLSIAQRAALIRSYENYLLDPPVSLEPALKYLAGHPDEATAVKIAGLEVLSLAGALKGDRAGEWLVKLLDDPDPNLRLSVVKAIEDTRPARASGRLVKLLEDAGRPAREREAVVKALRALHDRTAVAALKTIVADDKPTTPEARSLRLEAFRSLAALDPDYAAVAARGFLERHDYVLQTEAAVVLGASVEGTRFAAKLFLDKKVPRELLPQVSDALRKHAGQDAELAKMLTEVMRTGLLVGNSPEEVERVRKLVQTKGDAKRGRALYLNANRLACITCHRLEGIGGNVGPDLTRLWETQSIEKIMESLIEPSKEIKEGYQAYIASTRQGQVYTGLKVAQNADEVVLRDANARDVRIPMKDLDELKASKQSLMPDNVVAQLTYDEFIDLVAFLKDRKAQESLRGLALDFFVVGPFGPDLAKPYPPEQKPDPEATYPGAKTGEVLKWQPAHAEPSGLLNLRAIFNKEHISAYALTYVYSARPQKAEMLLGSDDTVRVWIDGRLVHEYATPRSAVPDQDRVTVALKEGWNRVLVKVVNGTDDHGLYLRFVGDGLRVARTPFEVK
jgi:putative membrane-bound dehydrogenase-like protein